MKATIQPSGFRLFKLKTPLLALILAIVVESIHFSYTAIFKGLVPHIYSEVFFLVHWPAIIVARHLLDWIGYKQSLIMPIFFSCYLIECWMILFVSIWLFRHYVRKSA